MPIYDYVCSSCATRTEFIHAIDAPAPRFCPTCGAEDTLRKAFVAPTVHFKGSGWAKKDRSSASSSKSKAAAAGEAKSGSTDGSSDAAPERGANVAAEGKAAGDAAGSTGASASAGEG